MERVFGNKFSIKKKTVGKLMLAISYHQLSTLIQIIHILCI